MDNMSIAAYVTGCLLPVLAVGIVLFTLYLVLRRRRRRNIPEKSKPTSTNQNSDHTILRKDSQLKDKIVVLADDTAKLNEEFKALESLKQDINETTLESAKKANSAHNRYNDIAPYDGKFITTQTPAGDPPTTYINASLVKLDHLKQTFIATQAPKPNSFENFWQMVLENKVGVIVMITALVEENRRKADKYWPDEENKMMDLDNGVKLEHKETSYQGTYFHRTIEICPPAGESHVVHQLQITKWMDLTAPDDTRILLDLVNKTKELVGSNTDIPVVVHCSAGIGRTGTFIAVYKLIQDYYNPKVKVLDPFLTVVEMRRQRMKMVQKLAQYIYIVRCVKDLVRMEEVEYYDN